ncbi:MAG: hypothetical protein ACRC10_04610 [Thermoguttaceae bacterium]
MGTSDVSQFNRALEFVPYDQKADWIKVGIKGEPYRLEEKWERPILAAKTPRGEPLILPPERLRASTGYGGVKIKKSSSATSRPESKDKKDVEGRKWIVVTGLIPIQEQKRLYFDTFSEAMNGDPARDRPEYFVYKLERAEYDYAKGQPGEWKAIDAVHQQGLVREEWEGSGTEPVVQEFLIPSSGSPVSFAFPLPPLTKKQFGQEVAFPPEVPLKTDYELEQAKLKQAEEEEKSKEVVAAKVLTTEELLNDPKAGSKASSTVSTQGGGMGRSGSGPGGSGPGGSGPGGYGGPSGSGGPSGPTGVGGAGRAQQVSVPYYLFRYFDFDVEEGKNYVYRVKLLVLNPNAEMDVKYLADPGSSRRKFLESEYSTSTVPVSVDSTATALVKETLSPGIRRSGGGPLVVPEPSARLLSVYFDMDEAAEWVPAGDERPLIRGSVVNSVRVPCTSNDVKIDKEKDSKKPGGVGGSTSKKNSVETQPFDIRTNLCLLDTFGGYDVEGKMRSPGKALFLDPSGAVVVHDALDDFTEIQRLTPTPK